MVWGLDSVKGLWAKPSTPTSSSDSMNPSGSSSPASEVQSLASGTPSSTQNQSNIQSLSSSSSSSPSSALPSSISSPSGQEMMAPAEQESYWFSRRSRRQFALFGAGATFLLISTRITARALRRKYVQTLPSFYHPSNAPPVGAVNGPIEAVEALTVASMNVFSSTLMLAGGTLWAMDVSGIDELRGKVRAGLGFEGEGAENAQAVEEEFEEWLAATLDRKDRKDRKKEKEEEDEGRGDEAKGGSIADREDVRAQWNSARDRSR